MYSTQDFYLACTLHSIGAKLDGHEKTKKGKVTFYFKRTEDIDRCIEAYYSGANFVSPQSFAFSIKFLKSLIRSKD